MLEAKSVEDPIGRAVATVEVTIESDDDFHGVAANVRAYLIFMQGQTPLLTTSAIGYTITREDTGKAIYRANLTMNARDAAVGQPVSFLRKTDHVLLAFGRMPPNSHVLGGHALCTINDLNIEFPVPEQVADGIRILVGNVAEPLRILNRSGGTFGDQTLR